VLFAFDTHSVRAHYGSQPDERNMLISDSRKAIIDTGFSQSYFDQHFKLVQVFNKPGDVRVMWRLNVNEYEIQITDAIGYYTGAGGKKVYVHSIANTLGSTRNIEKTISRGRAQALMASCVGKFTSESAVLMKFNNDRNTSLYLMAYPAKSPGTQDRERENRPKETRPADAPDRPALEDDRDNRPLTIGYINLETGKCSKGKASATP